MQYINLVPGTRAALRATGGSSLDKTRFLAFVEAGHADNTASVISDQSGHNNHFTQSVVANQPVAATDAEGRAYLDFARSGDPKFLNMPLSSGQANYTFYLVLDVQDVTSETYLVDSGSHTLLLGTGPGAGLYYSSLFGGRGDNVRLTPGLQLLTWRLHDTEGGRVLSNKQLLYNGSYTQANLTPGRFGLDFGNDYGGFRGKLYALAVAVGGDTADQQDALAAYFKSKYGLPY